VQSDTFVEADDALGDAALNLVVDSVAALPNALHFQIQKEALYHRIVSQQFPLRLMLQRIEC
jgi:hypothetical protein